MAHRFTVKIAAWLHDPPEKAFVLYSPKGHEGGTVASLSQRLFGSPTIPEDIADIVRQADRLAAAADRPDRPRGTSSQPWSFDRTLFARQPELVHPLSGERYDLGSLAEIGWLEAEALGTKHLAAVLEGASSAAADEAARARQTFLRLWRLGPHVAPDHPMGSLWRLLPADTRVPDHSIWDHLGLTSALAGVLAACHVSGTDATGLAEPALLVVSLGPVQSFIAESRRTSDFWAGSHLLSFLTWEAMRPIVEEFGPDSILFPALRGVPIVDAWLAHEMKALTAQEIRKVQPEWERSSDAHPLFIAALPNRFVAVVPHFRAAELAREAERAARDAACRCAREAWQRIEREAWRSDADKDTERAAKRHALSQLEQQLAGFPEVYAAAVPWPCASGDGSATPSAATVREKLAQTEKALGCAFFESEAWHALAGTLDGAEHLRFFTPNGGVLYPAVLELAERALAAAKNTRTFEQLPQRGYRCSLCGEREWLAGSEAVVQSPRDEKAPQDPWPEIARRRPSWARGTEHLCGVCLLKRLWPTLFVEKATPWIAETSAEGPRAGDDAQGGKADEPRRYVVSTHTMALVPVLEKIIRGDLDGRIPKIKQTVDAILGGATASHVALPRRLVRSAASQQDGTRLTLAKRAVAAFEALDDMQTTSERQATGSDGPTAGPDARRRDIEKILGTRLETYYGLLLLDGDSMGAWLSGGSDGGPGRPALRDLWHRAVRNELEQAFRSATDPRAAEAFTRYAKARGVVSPGYHVALSSALNDFALHLVPFIVEEIFAGKVIYAGGDDVLAMFPVKDLVPAALLLRAAWSGAWPGTSDDLASQRDLILGHEDSRRWPAGAKLGRGFARIHQRLLRTMGTRATCSVGAMVTHHSTPLGAVLAELRAAEQRAKRAGRNAFSLTLDKRAGGTTTFTCAWGFGPSLEHPPESPTAPQASSLATTPVGLLARLQRAFEQDVSRQGAYNVLVWLETLAAPGGDGASAGTADMAGTLLKYQLLRAAEFDRSLSDEEKKARKERLARLADDLTAAATAFGRHDPARWLAELVRTAEFLARPERAARTRRGASGSARPPSESASGRHAREPATDGSEA